MPEMDSFAELLRRVRAGDVAAADELWRHYEPFLRREVRLRLRDPSLRRLFDEDDVCQSVMASFFVRAAAGQFELEGPEHLRNLLARMGRNKLAGQARRHQAGRRDHRRVGQFAEGEEGEAPGADPTPSQAVAWQEMFQEFRNRLSTEEHQLADLRTDGLSWADIAARLGGTADARRIQLGRAVERVSRELGLAGVDDE
jgi:RNA polymerase sigma factor (sigma-70 family)